MVDQYIFSGSLPENASTYVIREADAQLYEGLKEGKFCYVLNSRQSGKSSLRVRTMQRLRDDGVQCAAIDLSAGGIQNVPPEQWYADLIDTLIDSFGLDLDFGDWWEANQLNSLVTRFRKFLEEVLLVEVLEDIVIFIDEIDSVLSLNFPTYDFFALIRACYNKRADNPEYNRLTFCLLGVASPSNLIEDKQRTPFNIGKAIPLKGFQLNEAEPLEKGLRGKFSNPQVIMQEILQWTVGQPFLTQKLCQFMVEESEQDNPRSVKQVVKSRIIENWESQDEPEHLRTIQARILRDEQKAGYLLELYQQVRLSEEQAEVKADETSEQSELQLSGLVVRQQGKLIIYNHIYREIFDSNWIENQLKNLRPYSENFRFWVASGGADESRLLRGKALQGAEKWMRDKDLSYQDKQYLAASKEKEIQEEIVAKQQEATLERERKDREAAEARNQLLSQANKKAQRRISIGVVVLFIAVLGAIALGIFSSKQVDIANQAENELKKATQQTKDAKENEKKAKESTEKAKKQELVAKKSEKVAKQKVIEADKTVKKAQEQASASKKNALQFEEGVKIARQDLNLAKNQKLDIQEQLQNIENRLKRLDIRNKQAKLEVETVQKLNKLAGKLQNYDKSSSGELTFSSNEVLRLSALSFNINNHQLKQALVLATMSQAYQQLKKLKEAKPEIQQSDKFLLEAAKTALKSTQGLQIQVLFYKSQGNLEAQNKNYPEAIRAYSKAFNILKNYPNQTDFTKDNQLLTGENIESVYRDLIKLTSQNYTELELRKQVEKSLSKHLYAQLEYFLKAKNWKAADEKTSRLMLNISKREEEEQLDRGSINNFSCQDLQKIDQLWVNADNRFGFSVQKEIWNRLRNNTEAGTTNDFLTPDYRNYLRFAKAVGWYDDKGNGEYQPARSTIGDVISLDELYKRVKDPSFGHKGSLPIGLDMYYITAGRWQRLVIFFSRVATCKV
ncbi:AAA-like domain-containing protein [Nostoc sp.]|uniref:AAA-like domain-containing protein n=1 Tax=Nostoc sp. TaxID=1180 RepID=UPI002FFB76EE